MSHLVSCTYMEGPPVRPDRGGWRQRLRCAMDQHDPTPICSMWYQITLVACGYLQWAPHSGPYRRVWYLECRHCGREVEG